MQDKLPDLIKEAMKARDKVRLGTLQMLSSAIKNAAIDARPNELTVEEELKVIKSEAKKRRDAIEAYKKADHTDRADSEQVELTILEEFLPKELEDDAVEKLVAKAIKEVDATSLADMGKAMGAAMKAVDGQANGDRVLVIVKQKLS